MKSYPSLLPCTGTDFREMHDAYIFDKLDGSNIRFEWSKKSGWYKFGTRQRLFDQSDKQFGPAIPLFERTLADKLSEIARAQKWERVIVFAEYHGPHSFAGQHLEDDDRIMRLELFDVAPYKQGLLGPAEYLKLFGDKVPMAKFLGRHNWTRGFVEKVWNQELEGVTFEGVVGKTGNGRNHNLVMAKAKTKSWIEKVRALYSRDEAEKIIRS
jgi:hypothetical protein